jgi:hypothetical protein
MLFVIVVFAQKYCLCHECFHFPSVVCLFVLPSGSVNNVGCLKRTEAPNTAVADVCPRAEPTQYVLHY